ncbi:MAG: lytic transglycosylase domain-containing protein [Enhydrobacter sp.]|nr:lytic transglycosylase domain-containing protein [Enhydrobacter sp.]
MSFPWAGLLLLMAVSLALGLPCFAPARAQSKAGEARLSVDETCRALAAAAADNDLPEEFFTRLIWQESRFDPSAVSRAGAQGIAQFMPQTAALRGLASAFDPLQALREAASYLRELRTTFRGSLGLAAAAYNAGPGQVEAWIGGRGSLPLETQAYVRIVTGYGAETWKLRPHQKIEDSTAPIGTRCIELAKLMQQSARYRLAIISDPAWGPWGAQVAINWSEGDVLASYERLRRKHVAVLGDRLPLVLSSGRRLGPPYMVRVSEKSRTDAEALCAKLRAAGAACLVIRNPNG